jgi:hypothetical protein
VIWLGLIALVAILVAMIIFARLRALSPAESLQVLIRKRRRELERNPGPDPPNDDSGFY